MLRADGWQSKQLPPFFHLRGNMSASFVRTKREGKLGLEMKEIVFLYAPLSAELGEREKERERRGEVSINHKRPFVIQADRTDRHATIPTRLAWPRLGLAHLHTGSAEAILVRLCTRSGPVRFGGGTEAERKSG